MGAGQYLAVLGTDVAATNALMRAMGGFEDPAVGRLTLRGPSAYLAEIDSVLEPELSVAENISLFASFCGCDLNESHSQLASLAACAGLDAELESELGAAGAGAGLRIALTVALERAEPGLLLIGRIKTPIAGHFRAWVDAAIVRWRSAGGAVVQVISEPTELLAPADRALMIDSGSLLACGHTESLANPFRVESRLA